MHSDVAIETLWLMYLHSVQIWKAKICTVAVQLLPLFCSRRLWFLSSYTWLPLSNYLCARNTPEKPQGLISFFYYLIGTRGFLWGSRPGLSHLICWLSFSQKCALKSIFEMEPSAGFWRKNGRLVCHAVKFSLVLYQHRMNEGEKNKPFLSLLSLEKLQNFQKYGTFHFFFQSC